MYNYKLYAFADEASPEVDGQITAMKRNGLQGLEIRGVDGTNVADITLEKAREVRKKLDDNGLITWSIGSPIGKIKLDDDFNAHLDKLRHVMDIAHILGAENLRMFSFFVSDEEADGCKDEIISRLGVMQEIVRDAGVYMCHENEKGIYGSTAVRCLELHKALPEMKGIFDPANFVQCNEDTKVAWDLLKPYIYYMHIKDAIYGRTVVPAGMGDGNVAYVVKEYLKNGGVAMTVEPHLKKFVGLAGLEQEGDTSQIGGLSFRDTDDAFDSAINALKAILK